MNKHQRQMIKEAYQEGYYQALDEGLGKLLAKSGKFLKNLFRGKRRGLINFGGELPEPNDPTPFKRQASILFDRLMNSLNTDVNNYYISLGPDAVEIVDKIRASIIGLESSVRAGEITNNQAILKLMRRHPAFFDNFGTATGSRFDDLPGLDP
tara:strand:+ start:186 stop:644 length:459 start_codon:yes stop_codon:yes gene_type:complete